MIVRKELSLETQIWVLTGVVAAVTIAAYLTLVEPLGAGPTTMEIPWWLVAITFAAAERWVVHLHFRRSTHSLSLGELNGLFEAALAVNSRSPDPLTGKGSAATLSSR